MSEEQFGISPIAKLPELLRQERIRHELSLKISRPARRADLAKLRVLDLPIYKGESYKVLLLFKEEPFVIITEAFNPEKYITEIYSRPY